MSNRIYGELPLESLLVLEQVRKQMDEESLTGLLQSMRESGLQAPIQVLQLENGRYRVIFGHRRVEAARKAGWKTIPAIIENGNLAECDLLVRQLVENMQREDLKPTQKARGIQALINATGTNAAQAALKLGLTSGTVSKLLSLLSLPEELQKQIDAGDLPATAAYHLTKLNDPEAQSKLAGQVASGDLTRDKVIKAVKQTKQKHSRKPRPVRVTARLEKRQSVSVAADGLDLNSFVSMLEKLLSHAQKARNEGLTLQALLKRLSSVPAAVGTETVAA